MTSQLLSTRPLASLEVTAVGLGCNNFGGRIGYEASLAVIDAALDAGINFFDTADTYGGTDSETFIGRALQGRRDRVFIATKFGMAAGELRGGATPEYVRESIRGSLTRLQTDYVDLYQLHQPDHGVPIVETLDALNDLVDEGLVREIGCSNFDVAMLEEAATAAGDGARFVSVQNEYSLFHREPEDGVLEACTRLGIGFLPYFPLYSGILTGKYRRDMPRPEGTRVTGNPRWEDQLTDSLMDRVEGLATFAAGQGYELIDLAFAWLLSRPQLSSVIAGATKPEQVHRNAAAASWALTKDDLETVDEILAG